MKIKIKKVMKVKKKLTRNFQYIRFISHIVCIEQGLAKMQKMIYLWIICLCFGIELCEKIYMLYARHQWQNLLQNAR